MKVVLVIEEPNECIDCPCYRQTKEDDKLFEDCKAMMMPLNWREVTEKPEWCPLKPLPKKILTLVQLQNGNIMNIQETSFVNGWNACLKEIEE